jgi:hypothetical protein
MYRGNWEVLQKVIKKEAKENMPKTIFHFGFLFLARKVLFFVDFINFKISKNTVLKKACLHGNRNAYSG